MNTVHDLKEMIMAFDLRGEAAVAIDETRDQLLEKQRDQLLRGERANGKKIGKYKNPAYAAKKYAMNPLAGEGNMDWKLTGALHNDLFVDVREEDIIFDSGDSKTGDLIKRFGDPFGINKDNQEEYVKETLDDMYTERFRKATGL